MRGKPLTLLLFVLGSCRAPPHEETRPEILETARPADSCDPVPSAQAVIVPEKTLPPPGPCPNGWICPKTLPYHHEGTTRGHGPRLVPHEHCGRRRGAGGRERIYRFFVPEAAFLGVSIEAAPETKAHLYLLSATDPERCVAHGDQSLGSDLTPGNWLLLVNNEKEGAGGSYQLEANLLRPSRGSCAFRPASVARTHDQGQSIELPATGPLARESHLVTREEPPPYPDSATDRLDRHWARSQRVSGLVMHRTSLWAAPEGGGSFFGAGVVKPELLSALEESWYVTMRWTPSARPPPGTRMIARVPGTPRAVVLAAGFETGPSDLTHLGGVSEETHAYLGTTHLAPLTLGFAADLSLPLGPRDCTD